MRMKRFGKNIPYPLYMSSCTPIKPSTCPEVQPHVPLPVLVNEILDSVMQIDNLRLISRGQRPPSFEVVETFLTTLRKLVFPGFFGHRQWTDENLQYNIGQLIEEVRCELEPQLISCLEYRRMGNEEVCTHTARSIAEDFLKQIPKVREILSTDVQAALDGDPAVRLADEIVFAYPGLFAIFVYRFAHILFQKGVPVLPRMMTEHAHNRTGIDIHPGASIGRSFFIDHGTGVTIGETCNIGDNVKIYQGVTLGALSFAKDQEGRIIKGNKRHPTIEDNVTIYANATVLGGDTVIGNGCIIGGGVFITKTVPPGYVVRVQPAELKMYIPSEKGSILGGSAKEIAAFDWVI